MKLFLTQQQIQKHIISASEIINPLPHDVILGTLSGSVLFFSDLIRNLTFDFEVDFIKPHEHFIVGPIGGTSLRGKSILVVEDIVDTGSTLSRIVEFLRSHNCGHINICSLLKRRGYELPEHFLEQGIRLGYCEEIDKGWAVGYGMDDFEGRKRNLPNIYITNE